MAREGSETAAQREGSLWQDKPVAPRLLATRYYYRTRTGDAPEKTASRNCAASSKLFVECRFIRRPHLHQTRRTGAGESLAPRLLATRYYYRTRPGDTPEKTASRNCAASS